MTVLFSFSDVSGLVLRQNLGVELVNSDLRRNGLSSLVVVARHHDDILNSAFVQCFQRVTGFTSKRVEYAYYRRQNSRYTQIEVGILRGNGMVFILLALGNDAFFILKDEVCTSDDDLLIVDHT